MHVGRLITAAAMAAALFVLSSNVNADIIRWELRDVAFDDGGTLTGFLDFDSNVGFWYPIVQAHAGILYGYDFFVTGGNHPAFEYTPDNSIAHTGGQSYFSSNDGTRSLMLGFTHSTLMALGQVLPNGPVGTTYFLDTVDHEYPNLSSQESFALLWPNSERFVLSGGYLLATASSPSVDPIFVPEPGTWMVMLAGLIGVIGLKARRTR